MSCPKGYIYNPKTSRCEKIMQHVSLYAYVNTNVDVEPDDEYINVDGASDVATYDEDDVAPDDDVGSDDAFTTMQNSAETHKLSMSSLAEKQAAMNTAYNNWVDTVYEIQTKQDDMLAEGEDVSPQERAELTALYDQASLYQSTYEQSHNEVIDATALSEQTGTDWHNSRADYNLNNPEGQYRRDPENKHQPENRKQGPR